MSLFHRLLRRLLHLTREAWAATVISLAMQLARLERHRRTIRSLSPGAQPLGPRVALFCHWDRRGRIAEHVRCYLEALRAEGLAVVFVSNAGWLANEDAHWIASVSAAVIVRRNLGYDFAAWRDALEACGLPNGDTTQLVLVNDSVYGPFFPLTDLFRRIDAEDVPVLGLTDSWQRRYHLQSFFLACGPAAFRNLAWHQFWSDVLPSRSKQSVVARYEIGLTQALLRGGVACRALFPYEMLLDTVRNRVVADANGEQMPADPLVGLARDAERRILLAAARRVALNPTADFWQVLMERGFPFLKRELLRTNPSHVVDVACWRAVLNALAPGQEAVIRRDLALSMRHTTP